MDTPIPTSQKGLILTRQWQERPSGQSLVYWLAAESGPVRIEITDQESVFFIAAEDLKQVQTLLDAQLNWRHAETELSLFADSSQPAIAGYFKSWRDVNFARSILQKHVIKCFEADVRPTDRYLMERFIQGTLEVTGPATRKGGYLDYINPQLQKAEFAPGLKVISLDIETSITHKIVLSIALHGLDSAYAGAAAAGKPINKVFMLGEEDATENIEFAPTERALLLAFQSWFTAHDPDLVIGWNLVEFDLRYLQDRANDQGIDLRLGRGNTGIGWRRAQRDKGRYYAVVPGRVMLDGIELLRTATYKFESFSLENVAQELLGRGKLVHDVDARALAIESMFVEDKPALAKYNLEDCVLVWEIFERTRLIEFAVQRSCLTGLEMDRQGGSVAAFDFLYLPRLHREGRVAPLVTSEGVSGGASGGASKGTAAGIAEGTAVKPAGSDINIPGGYVFESRPGLYRDILILDFKSLYPSIIMTFQVDPLAMVSPEENRIPGFAGLSFAKHQSILPDIIKDLWAARDRARQEGFEVASQAIKIIMNSFYGVLGTSGCRFFEPGLVSSITLRGHEILQTTRDLIEAKGFPVIYGDTDSVFVLMENTSGQVQQAGKELVTYLNDWWREQLATAYGIDSHLEIELETHFTRFLMPRVRGSEKGSKKRYSGLVVSDTGEAQLIFKGLESVRSDWTPLAREFQRELYRRYFLDEPYEDYIKTVVASVTQGEVDDKLVLRRRIRRKLADYTKNVPPQIKAARLAEAARAKQGLAPMYEYGGWIEYVMTLAGPEDVKYTTARLDYDFYITRQIAPVADAILGFTQTSLSAILAKQTELF